MSIAPDEATVAAALAALRTELGEANVLDDPATLDGYARSTAARPVRPRAVARPGTPAEVAALARIAARFRLPVYPLSTGRNWGYGDACAVQAGQVIVELARMNRILDYDAELGYVVLEPGVTQQQLSDFLRAQGDAWWMDSTGAGPDTSLIGNTLERGFGHSPYGNRLQHVAGLQVVLAGGEVLDTGFGHYPTSRVTHLFPYGIGPFLDGLFTQSNFGIVTRLAMWLLPKSERINHFIAHVGTHEGIGPVVDALRPLRLDGTLRSVIHIGNDMRLLSGGMVFPRELAPGATRLPDDLRARLRSRAGIGAWAVSGALYGSKRQVAAARHALAQALRGTGARTVYLTESRLRWGALSARLLGTSAAGRRLRAQIDLGQSLFAMNRGVPDGRFLAGAYWRRRGGLPSGFPHGANPAADNCGLLWISPILPLTGRALLEVHGLADPVFARFGFDLFVTFSMITERALGGVLTVAYDQEDGAETARARECYRTLFELMMAQGYIPYRVGNQSMADLDPYGDSFWRTVARIKAALDPEGVIAPGRYEPGRARPGS